MRNGTIVSIGLIEIKIYKSGISHLRDGQLHRDDGPAVIHHSGYQAWHQYGEFHRMDGPAVINANGYTAWFQNGLRHRIDGPAAHFSNGDLEFWIDGVLMTQSEFEARSK